MSTRAANPYRPGFNQSPVVFAGRSDVMDGALEALEIAAYDGRTPRPLALVGPRGLGKTVTLGAIRDLAAERFSWPSVHVEAKAGTSMVAELAARLAEPRKRRARSLTGGEVEARAFGVGAGVKFDRATDDPTTSVALALEQAMEAAVSAGSGLVLTLDEVHAARPEDLGELFGTLQEAVPRGWPLVVAFAALPVLRETRGRRSMPTYLERAEWHDLESLSIDEAREALVGPSVSAGRPMTPAAADLLLDHTGGYPYAIQVAGHFAWRASHGAASVSLDHARSAVPRIEADLGRLYESRWQDASPKEQDYLRAMAAIDGRGDQVKGGPVAAELGQTAPQVSYLRARLLTKGTIYRRAGGALHFITPGMGAWIRALDQED